MSVPAGIDRPLSIPEIVDRAVTITVRRWQTLAVIVLIQALPAALVTTFAPQYATIWTVVMLFVDPLLAAAVIVTATTPEMPSAGAALVSAARRYRSLFVAQLLTGLIALGAALIVGIPLVLLSGLIGAGFGAIGVSTFAAIAIAIVLPTPNLVIAIIDPIVMLENMTAGDAVGIAFRRARNAGWWRSWRLGLTYLAFDLLPTYALMAAGQQMARLAHLPIVNAVLDMLTSGITLGIGIVVATVISLEMRVRYDGSDLVAALQARDGPQLPVDTESVTT